MKVASTAPIPEYQSAERHQRSWRRWTPALTMAVSMAAGSATPAAAQPLPDRPELSCSGLRIFERWGAGTDFPANRKPAVQNAQYPFNKRFRIHPEQKYVEISDDGTGKRYYRLTVDGSNQTANTVRQDGFYMTWSLRDGWYYNYDHYSVSRSPSGAFTYKYVARAEDRNKLIFELHKSEGSCQLIN